MYRVLFQVGAVLLIVSSLVWLGLHLYSVVNPPAKELRALVILGGVMMLPELLYQVRQFFTSGSSLDD